MSEFRIPSHNKRYDRKSASKLLFMGLFFIGIILLFMYYLNSLSNDFKSVEKTSPDYTPDPKNGIVYHKPGFSLSYVDQYELPEWVSYHLTVDMMNKPKHERDQDFDPDPAIESGSGHYKDYKGSGFRRGHLVPSADMAWNKEAMDATFLLSNVAPMREEFNDGIWLELEHNVRDWSRLYKSIRVVAGPVFEGANTTIGENQILVPEYFYKAIFTLHDGKPKVIGFLFDQMESVQGSLVEYMVPIDSIEKVTGLDLFEGLYGDWEIEIDLEKGDIKMADEWSLNERWYNQRMNHSEK